MAYYGVYISNDKKIALCDDDTLLVFKDKNEAFKYLKKNRESRLKCFDTYEQAEHFAKCGLESTIPADVSIPVFDSNEKQNSDSNGNTNNCDKTTTTTTTPKAVGEKPSSFRAPSSQELVKFRKLIEQGDTENVHKTVWSNPRYLVSSGDTPTILKESFRYNGLHVASIAKNAEMCALILNTVGDPKFITLYHGRDDHRTAEEVSTILLDLYLNTPEKGRGETALHLATKFGAVSVVETLTSYQECQMNRNIEGMLPKDIICTRNEAAGGEVVKAIRTLLEGRFYVPVMRSVDNSLPAVIGEAFAETQLPETNIGDDLLSPKMEIRAIAGPMNKEQAETFRKRWKTPPRTLSSPASYLKSPPVDGSPLNGSPLSSYPSTVIRQRYTPNKTSNGDTPRPIIENMSRRLFLDANMNDEKNESDVPTQTINIPSNMNSAKKNLFRNYRDQSHEDSFNESLITDKALSNVNDTSTCDSPYSLPGFRERNLKLADVDKGLEVIGRGLAKDNNIIWREHWLFLDEFVNIGTHDGLTKFERYLQDRLDERMKPPKFKMCQTSQQNMVATPVSKICNKLTKLNFVKDITPNHDQEQQTRSSTPSSPVAFHAYLCVEKSCQIFAKRLLKPIAKNPNNIATINDVFHGELTRLKSLICSYKNDIRFFGIDFSATHSRFAHMIVAFLEQSDDEQVIPIFEQTIKKILQTKEKALQNAIKNGMHDQIKSTSQFICLLEQILKRLTDSDNVIFPEILTTEKECSEIWQDEYKCDCEWSNVAEGKHNRSIKRKSGSGQRTSEGFVDFCSQINEMNLNVENNTMDEEDDDDVFMSLDNSDDEFFGSDSDEFFTPPQSPLQEMLDDSDMQFEYDNFIYGSEPTKMDNDVLRALHDVEIDKKEHPNVYCWHNALMKYSLEERSRFPQPQHNSRTLKMNFASPSVPSATSQSKTLSRTPIKDILPKANQYLLKPSKLSMKD